MYEGPGNVCNQNSRLFLSCEFPVFLYLVSLHYIGCWYMSRLYVPGYIPRLQKPLVFLENNSRNPFLLPVLKEKCRYMWSRVDRYRISFFSMGEKKSIFSLQWSLSGWLSQRSRRCPCSRVNDECLFFGRHYETLFEDCIFLFLQK